MRDHSCSSIYTYPNGRNPRMPRLQKGPYGILVLPLRSESERSDRIIFGEPSNSLTIPHYPLHEESSCGRFGTLRFTVCTSFLQEAVPKCVFLLSSCKTGLCPSQQCGSIFRSVFAQKRFDKFAIFIKKCYRNFDQ